MIALPHTYWLMVSREVKSIELCLSKEMTNLSLLLKYMWMTIGSTIDHLAHEFSEEIKREFELSMVRELN